MSSGVRSKIASFEAQSGGGQTTPTRQQHPNFPQHSSPAGSSALGGMPSLTTSPNTHPHHHPSPIRPSPSTKAAQNRVSRIRQEQNMIKDHHPLGSNSGTGNAAGAGKSQTLVEKQIEKRRIQKEQRGTSAVLAQQSPASTTNHQDFRNLARRTEYESSLLIHNKPEDDEKANNHNNKSFSKESASPGQGGTNGNRLSKMQRMQRMLGHSDSSKKGATSSSGGRKSIAESSTVSAATTAVVKNSMSSSSNPVVVQPRRQRQTLMQSRVKRHSAMNNANHKQSPVALDKAPSHATTSATSTRQAAFSGIPSPTSDVDTAFGPTDHSIDPDDEATLTSVRQIMNGENHHGNSTTAELLPSRGAGGDRSYHYQNLQNFEDSTRTGMRSVQPLSSGRGSRPKNGTGPATTAASDGHISRKDRNRKNSWPQEEKSDKSHNIPRVFRTTSSSDYDTDGDASKQSNVLDGPTHSQLSEVNEFFTQQPKQRRMVDDDENTFDYGDKDDDASNASASFAMRQRRLPMDPPPPQTATSSEWKEINKHAPSSLINKDDVEHYTKSLGSPTVRMGAGVLAGVTIGCIMLGPAGLLAGAALVGLGIGAMQIPEEERQKIQVKVQETAHQVQEKALEATEKLSNSCAASYEESGVAEHLPPCISIAMAGTGGGKEQVSIATADEQAPSSAKDIVGPTKGGHKGVGGGPPLIHDASHPRAEPKMSSMDRARNKKVACLRNVRILPAGQIHGLDPSSQPKAWLDVVASANTSEDEKIEALEEILILAKDKRRAQILLEEGILDSLIWTLDRYIEKVNHVDKSNWANPTITPNERRAAKLAASCCVTLGKTHCAAIHTEGDIQLVSMYQSGFVPEERQVAHMLHEIPHHVRITKLDDPTVVIPKKEIFGLRQLSLQQAEDFSQSIKAVIDGKL